MAHVFKQMETVRPQCFGGVPLSQGYAFPASCVIVLRVSSSDTSPAFSGCTIYANKLSAFFFFSLLLCMVTEWSKIPGKVLDIGLSYFSVAVRRHHG